MNSIAIANGCTVSRLSGADLPELADLVSAIEYVDEISNVHSLADLEYAFHEPDAEPEKNAIVVRQESGHLIAYGWNRVPPTGGANRQVIMMGGCHPAWRNRGISSLIVSWLQQRAVGWYRESFHDDVEPLTVLATSEARVMSDDDLLVNNGFELARRFADMYRRLDEQPQPVHPPAGVSLTALSPELSAGAWAVHNRARRTIPGAPEMSLAQWNAELVEHEHYGCSFVAIAGGDVVGYVLNSIDTDHAIGWTARLGVEPARQRAGIGRSLLKQSLGRFYELELVGAGIGVEGPGTMTIDMYRSLGYEVAESVLTYVWRPTIAMEAGDSTVNQPMTNSDSIAV